MGWVPRKDMRSNSEKERLHEAKLGDWPFGGVPRNLLPRAFNSGLTIFPPYRFIETEAGRTGFLDKPWPFWVTLVCPTMGRHDPWRSVFNLVPHPGVLQGSSFRYMQWEVIR